MNLIDEINECETWALRLEFIADLGRKLYKDPDLLQDDYLVRGCNSAVWINMEKGQDGMWIFRGYSNSALIRGYLYIIFWMINGKTTKAILDYDMKAQINKINLENIVSPSRVNGMRIIIDYILNKYLRI